MNQYERNEIANLPPQYRPLTAWGYFGYTILFSLPIIGVILLIVFALSSSNINRRSFARSYFCLLIVGMILCGILLATGVFATIIGSIAAGGH